MFFSCTLHKGSESYTTDSSVHTRAEEDCFWNEKRAKTGADWPGLTAPLRSVQYGKHRGGAGATKHRIKQANKKGDQTNLISFARFMLASPGRGPVKPCG